MLFVIVHHCLTCVLKSSATRGNSSHSPCGHIRNVKLSHSTVRSNVPSRHFSSYMDGQSRRRFDKLVDINERHPPDERHSTASISKQQNYCTAELHIASTDLSFSQLHLLKKGLFDRTTHRQPNGIGWCRTAALLAVHLKCCRSPPQVRRFTSLMASLNSNWILLRRSRIVTKPGDVFEPHVSDEYH